jgi:hypothetical protein
MREAEGDCDPSWAMAVTGQPAFSALDSRELYT